MLYPILILLLSSSGIFGQQPCASRDFNNGGTVCVCNSTYCDTIARPSPLPAGQFLVYTSNKAGSRFEQSNGTFQFWQMAPIQIFVNPFRQYQSIIGWGGAFTDATGININSLPPNLRERLMRSYFSDEGIEYNLGRVPIGGTDFSTRPYSYDDGPADPNLTNFTLQPEDFDYKIPYINIAMNLTDGNLQLLSSAWTAPTWMKTNNNYSGWGFIRMEYYQAWADYYIRFVEAYQEQGIPIWAITTGNEPSDVIYPFDLEVVGWPSWFLRPWISEYLGPSVLASNVSDLNILILDDQRIFLPWYIQRVLRDPIVRAYVDGIAVHWYMDQYVPPIVLDETQSRFPEKFILSTEACNMPQNGEPAVFLGSWSRGEAYSFDIIQDLQHWVTGWIDWNMALDRQGGPNYIGNFVDSPIIVDPTLGEFYKQPMYYHLGHFSKFIPQGSVRIQSTVMLNDNIQVVAFARPDNGTAVVLLNRTPLPVAVDIVDSTRGTAPIELSARSITTVLYW